MEKAYYKREGRRFVKVTPINHEGHYYQTDGSFTENRTKDSIGLCITSNANTHRIMSFKEKMVSFGEVTDKTEIPKLDELSIAITRYNNILNIIQRKDHLVFASSYTISGGHTGWSCLVTYYGAGIVEVTDKDVIISPRYTYYKAILRKMITVYE